MRSVYCWSRSGSFALFMTKFEESKSESLTGLVVGVLGTRGKLAGNSSSAPQQRTSYHVVVVLFSTPRCCCRNKVPSV